MMFAKSSRYFPLEEVRTIDSRGRGITSKALRIIPQREAAFVHQVQQSDRLDLLAYKYYRDPDRWWLIADANPEWILPSNILDRDPIASYVFVLDLTTPPTEQMWLDLTRELTELPGGDRLFIDREAGELHIELNEIVTPPERVKNKIESVGFLLKEAPQLLPRSGTGIAIPPHQTT